jgi:hypothetical protein
MNTIDLAERGGPLADHVKRAGAEPLIITENGSPAAVVLALSNTDLETISLSTNPEFLALIERSRSRVQAEGGLSPAEMRRRVLPAN